MVKAENSKNLNNCIRDDLKLKLESYKIFLSPFQVTRITKRNLFNKKYLLNTASDLSYNIIASSGSHSRLNLLL